MPTAAEIRADLESVRAARIALAAGERVDEVWRDGRRLITGRVTLEGLNTLIETLERDLASQEAAEAGRPRRRAIALGWVN